MHGKRLVRREIDGKERELDGSKGAGKNWNGGGLPMCRSCSRQRQTGAAPPHRQPCFLSGPRASQRDAMSRRGWPVGDGATHTLPRELTVTQYCRQQSGGTGGRTEEGEARQPAQGSDSQAARAGRSLRSPRRCPLPALDTPAAPGAGGRRTGAGAPCPWGPGAGSACRGRGWRRWWPAPAGCPPGQRRTPTHPRTPLQREGGRGTGGG